MRLVAFLAAVAVLVVTSGDVMAANKYNKDYFGETIVHKAKFEDTLIHLARNNSLGFVEVRAANPKLDAWIPGEGAKIILPKKHLLPEAPRDGLVINLAEMRVYYFKEQGQPPQTYAISIGRDGLQTPTGSTKIVRKKDGPTWRPTKRMREEDPDLPVSVPPGPDNPLGTHALYLGWPQYLMHGTNKPYGIGRRVSSGCMRMYPEDIKALFPQVPVGTSVTVVDQPIKVGWVNDALYLEVSPNQEQTLKIEEQSPDVPAYKMTPADMARINKKAGVHKDKINWDVVKKAVAEHRGYPIEIMTVSGRDIAKPVQSEAAPTLEEVVQEQAAPVVEKQAVKKPRSTERTDVVYQESKAEPEALKDPRQKTVASNPNYNFNN